MRGGRGGGKGGQGERAGGGHAAAPLGASLWGLSSGDTESSVFCVSPPFVPLSSLCLSSSFCPFFAPSLPLSLSHSSSPFLTPRALPFSFFSPFLTPSFPLPFMLAGKDGSTPLTAQCPPQRRSSYLVSCCVCLECPSLPQRAALPAEIRDLLVCLFLPV